MKPLRLTLQAIGPYAGRQEIDFRAALDSGLFGIYGSTGSGKSTIFSAMTFALFGKTARNEQHASSLRSHHAEPGLVSEVELVFESAGRTYRVVRRPEQVRPAKRGGGEMKDSHKAWLFDVTGMSLDNIGDAQPGRVIAETKVGNVETEIERILGYKVEQFRQIVLLPQGKFETFLTASTDERLKILRELFDVSLYRSLTERLKDEARAADDSIRTARSVCEGRLQADGFANREALAAGIADARSRQAELSEAAQVAKAAAQGAREVFEAAARTERSFAEHLDAERAVAALEGEQAAMAELAGRLQAARTAQSLADIDAAVAQARADVKAAEATQSAAQAKAQAAGAKSEAAAQAQRQLAERAEEFEQRRVQLRDYQGFETRLAASERLRANVEQRAHDERTALAAARDAKARHATLQKQQAEAQHRHAQAQANVLRRAELKVAGAEVRERLDAATAYEKLVVQVAEERAQQQRLEAEHAAAKQAFDAAEATFSELEAALLGSHALHLVTHLRPGEPCLVCGSREHPSPASGTSAEADIVRRYERHKATLQAARSNESDASRRLEIVRDSCRRSEHALSELTPPAQPAEKIAAEREALLAAYKALGPEADLPALETDCRRIEAELSSSARDAEAKQLAAGAATTELALARQALDDALQAVPQDLWDAKALALALSRLSQEIAAYDTSLAEAAAAERKAAEGAVAATRDAENAKLNREAADARLATAKQAFVARLTEAGMVAPEFEAAKPDIPRIADFETRIRTHGERRAAAAERLERAASVIATVDRPDIVALKVACDTAQAAHEKANGDAIRATAALSQLERLSGDIATEIARLDKLEQDTAPLRELADAVSGRTYQKMELETFAIATMFDRVLETANLRLGPMTRGRYNLVRETEGRGNARRGLGIAIEDTFTGRARATATLSGGETFIAALALALGLSDVVESARGNIRLDTIFIDEGFGSLDTDSEAGTLEQVLQTLQDLADRNRAVGVISHVPLVQQAIPNGFWITSTANGSSVEVRG